MTNRRKTDDIIARSRETVSRSLEVIGKNAKAITRSRTTIIESLAILTRMHQANASFPQSFKGHAVSRERPAQLPTDRVRSHSHSMPLDGG